MRQLLLAVLAITPWALAPVQAQSEPDNQEDDLIVIAPAQEPIIADEPDPLFALLAAREDISLEEAQALLTEAYDAQPTASARARAFSAAAEAAGRERAWDLAFAWIDWALRETDRMFVDAEATAAEVLETGARLAIDAGNPVLARTYVRRQAGLEAGWRDDPEGLQVTFEEFGAACPDLIAEDFVRIRIERDAVSAVSGAGSARPGRCRYVHIRGEDEALIDMTATRSWIRPRDRIEGVVDVGLDRRDRDERAPLDRRLPLREQATRNLRFGPLDGQIGFVRYTRPGSEEVASFVYLIVGGEGPYLAVRVRSSERTFPPERYGDLAYTAMQALSGLETD